MASLREVLTLCKEGQTQKAYELSKADMEQQFPWAQREMGWTLYYLMKEDTDKNDYTSLEAHLEEFCTLDKLSMSDDNRKRIVQGCRICQRSCVTKGYKHFCKAVFSILKNA